MVSATGDHRLIPACGFVVRYLDGDPGSSPDLDGLCDSLQEMLALVSNVGGVDSFVLGDNLGELNKL